MSSIIHAQPKTHKSHLQVGPPYHCPRCHAAVTRVIHYADYVPAAAAPKPLDAFAEHVDYLDCSACGACSRVARLGDAVLPFHWPEDVTARGEADVVARALQRIAQQAPRKQNGDPIAAIVYRLVAGDLAPQRAIDQIRALVQEPPR